jgi:hypothetical protein
VTEQQRWCIHDPQHYPNHYYVFTTQNDARTALLALSWVGQSWELEESTT